MNRSMRMLSSLGLTACFGTAAMLVAANASAQMMPQVQPGYAAPAPATIPDHDLWNGRIGFGWYGTREIPFATKGNAVSTPLVGARYWVNTMIGVDGAIGFTTKSGSTTVSTTGVADQETKDTSATSFALHLGVPIAIFNMTHYSFQIIPELDFGIATGSLEQPANATTSTDLSGMLFQLGARAGAEIFFGFMGLPQLSLEASVGLFLSSQSAKSSPPNSSTKYSSLTISTAQFANPWDIFRESVAARYYF